MRSKGRITSQIDSASHAAAAPAAPIGCLACDPERPEWMLDPIFWYADVAAPFSLLKLTEAVRWSFLELRR